MKAIAVLGVVLAGCATTTSKLNLPPLQTVPSVELSRYRGTWYELASFPRRVLDHPARS